MRREMSLLQQTVTHVINAEEKCSFSEHMNDKKENSLIADTEEVWVVWTEDQTSHHILLLLLLSCFFHVLLFVAPWTVNSQAPLSMGFSRQEYWSGLPCPPPGDLPDPGIEPMSLLLHALAGGFFTTTATWEAPRSHRQSLIQSKALTLFSSTGWERRGSSRRKMGS